MTTKIKEIDKKSRDGQIIFENGYKLSSYHECDCCEYHWLEFADIEESDYSKLEFDLSNDNFFTRITDYGIQLNALNNFPLKIPGYGSNNGYYSHNLTLVLEDDKGNSKFYDITDCQEISD